MLFLPDHPSHIKAIEHIFHACNWYPHDVPPEKKQIARILRELSKELSSSQGNTHALEVVELLLHCTDGVGEPLEVGVALLKKRLFAVTALLDKVIHTLSSSSDTLAYLYNARGWTYLYQYHEGYQQALADFDHALQLDSNYDVAYHFRGVTYLWLKNLEQARTDLLRSWELAPTRGYFGWIAEWSKMEREGPDANCSSRSCPDV